MDGIRFHHTCGRDGGLFVLGPGAAGAGAHHPGRLGAGDASFFGGGGVFVAGDEWLLAIHQPGFFKRDHPVGADSDGADDGHQRAYPFETTP